MDLQEMRFAGLLALHNQIAEKKAGPKTFATKGKLIERIVAVAEAQGIDLAAVGQAEQSEVFSGEVEPSAEVTEPASAAPEAKKTRGRGVGDLAQHLLLDPLGYPHGTIADMVNAQIPGAAATAKSVRWYASKMRKQGIEVPARKRIRDDHIWITDPEAAAEWARGIQVVEPDTSDKG